MTQRQAFAIKPNGMVKGGRASYEADLLSGKVTYFAQMTVGVWPFSKTVPDQPNGEYQVDPVCFLSSRLQKVGDTTTIGQVSFQVTGVRPAEVDVKMLIRGTEASGLATIDTSGEFIRVRKIIGTARVPLLGTLTVEADETASRKPSWSMRLRSVCRKAVDQIVGAVWRE